MKSAEDSMLPYQSEREVCHTIVRKALLRAVNAASAMFEERDFSEQITTVAQLMHLRMKEGRKVMICGNGGSAMDAQHWVAELVGRYKKERRGLPAISLTADQAILTAVGNDYGFDDVFSRQVEALGQPGDILICISTSGMSENVLKARDAAALKEIFVVALTGADGGQFNQFSDMCLRVPATETARVQELHQIVYHSICEVIDDLCD